MLDNLLIDNGLGIVINQGSASLAIGNMIKGTKSDTQFIFSGYTNYFAGENHIVCNRREGIQNQSQFGMLLNNEISYNGDHGIILGEASIGNLVMGNNLACNIPENLVDMGTNNNLINNTEKPCAPCESPSVVCKTCLGEEDKSIEESKEGVNKCMQKRK